MVSFDYSQSSGDTYRLAYEDEEFSFTTQIIQDPSLVESYYPEELKKCHCGRNAIRFTDWKSSDQPGRCYFACSDWTEEGEIRKHFCDYREWCDPELNSRAVRIIDSMKSLWDYKRGELESISHERDVLRGDAKELVEDRQNLCAEIQGLHEELVRKGSEMERVEAVVRRLKLKLTRQGALINNIASSQAIVLGIFLAAGIWIGKMISF